MHPINKLLQPLGVYIGRVSPVPAAFRKQYAADYAKMRQNLRGFQVFQEMYYEIGAHPEAWGSYECRFVATHAARLKPANILDIGSYRLFIIGLLGAYNVTTLDVRSRQAATANETVVVSDAKQLALPDATFDMVTALCAIEHFGLGRYGDEFDENGDVKAMREFIRVLRPGGHLIFSLPVTQGRAAIAFNAHRIYTLEMARDLCASLQPKEELFYSVGLRRMCSEEELVSVPTKWDVYLGCWQKPLD